MNNGISRRDPPPNTHTLKLNIIDSVKILDGSQTSRNKHRLIKTGETERYPGLKTGTHTKEKLVMMNALVYHACEANR